MEERHQQELSEVAGTLPPIESLSLEDTKSVNETVITSIAAPSTEELVGENRLSKLEKARRKREARKDRERQRQSELEMEQEASAGSSMRETELTALALQLKPHGLQVVEIPSDGNCLYRAIAAQCGSDYLKIRT
jgi:hypothetical protein